MEAGANPQISNKAGLQVTDYGFENVKETDFIPLVDRLKTSEVDQFTPTDTTYQNVLDCFAQATEQHQSQNAGKGI